MDNTGKRFRAARYVEPTLPAWVEVRSLRRQLREATKAKDPTRCPSCNNPSLVCKLCGAQA